MSLAEMINTIKVSDDDVRARWWVASRHSYVPARLVAGLSQLPDRVPFHRYVGTRDLDQRRGDGRHDEREEERVAFLSPGMYIGHEGGLV